MEAVEARHQFDGGTGHGFAEGGNIHVDRACAENEQIDEALTRPGLDVETVRVTALDRVRHPRSQQERTAARGCLRLKHRAHVTHEAGEVLAILPLFARREKRRVTEEIEMHTIEFILLRDLANDRQAIVAHLLHGVVPKPLPPPGPDEPLGMCSFDRIAVLHVGESFDVIDGQVAALDLVHAQAPPDFFTALVALCDQLIEIVEALLAPLHQARMLDRREDLASVVRHAFVGDVDADGIELAARLARGIKHIIHHRIHVRAESAFALDVGCGIVLKKDAPLAIHGGGVVGGEADRLSRL